MTMTITKEPRERMDAAPDAAAREAEEWLSQLGKLSDLMTYHQGRIVQLRAEMDAVTSAWGEHISAGACEAPYARFVERIGQAEEEYRAEQILFDQLQRQVDEAVAGLRDPRKGLVLLYRYLQRESFPRIGRRFFVDRKTVRCWNAEALRELKLPEKAIWLKAAEAG